MRAGGDASRHEKKQKKTRSRGHRSAEGTKKHDGVWRNMQGRKQKGDQKKI